MAEAQVLDHLRLDRRDVLVGLVGTKRHAYDGAGSTAALGPLTLKNVIVLGDPFRFTKDNIDEFNF